MTPSPILFDYGGTLDTDGRHWANVLYEGFCRSGAEIAEDEFREAYVLAERALAKEQIIENDDDFYTVLQKKTGQEAFHLVMNGFWCPRSAQEFAGTAKSVAKYCEAYVRRQMQTTCSVLDQFSKQDRPLVLVSNFYGNMHAVLRGYGLDKYFQNVIESAAVGVRKPNPAIYRLGVEAAGCAPEEAIVVGDSFSKDIVPASSLGCHTIWLEGEAWNKNETVDRSLPTAIIHHLSELPDAVAKIEQA